MCIRDKVIGLFVIFGCFNTFAYTVSPIIINLAPEGDRARQTVDILNDGEEPIAIEISVNDRHITPEGNDISTPNPDLNKLL